MGRLPTLTAEAAAASDHNNAKRPLGTLLDGASNLMHNATGTAVLVPVIRHLQLRNMSVLQQLDIVKGVCVAPPQDAIAPRGDARLTGGVVHIGAWIKLERGGEGQLALLIPLYACRVAPGHPKTLLWQYFAHTAQVLLSTPLSGRYSG